MTQMAMCTVLSALGNKIEHESSTTKAAISGNILVKINNSESQKQQTGKTAEETIAALNRDTQNANQVVGKQDLSSIQERQEAAKIVAEMGAKAVGDLAQTMGWKDGSPEKIALHGLVGYLSAKVGGGNTAAGALSAMGSEYINTEIANYLKENTNLTPDQRNAIQQASAAGIGVVIGAGLGGDSNTVKQSAQMALRTEQFNRQLHPDEMAWIKENAGEFAKEQGIDRETAEKRLIAQAAQEVDFFWEKMIGENDFAASRFLKTSSGFIGDVPVGSQQTFINAEGKKQALFSATSDEKKATGLYADKLRAYDEQNQRIFTNAVQPQINNHVIPQSIKDGVVNTAKSAAYALDNPKETLRGLVASTMDCAISGNCIKEAWDSFDSASGQLFRKGYKQADVDYLYGKDMSTEVNAIQGARVAFGIAEVIPAGKGSVLVGKQVEKQLVSGVEKAKESFARGTNIKLGEERYTYVGEGQFIGPSGGKVINTGQVDSVTGNFIYQRINTDGKPTSSFFMISSEGYQINVHKPEIYKLKNNPDRRKQT